MDYQRAYEQTSAELDSVKRELAALVQASGSILKSKSFITSARSIFDLARGLTGADSGYIALLSEDGAENEVLFLEAGGRPCNVDPQLPMPIRGLRAESYRLKKAVFDNGFMDSEWMRYMPTGHVALKNVLFAPLILDGKAMGIMGLANKEGDFDERDAVMAEHFGELAAIALQNSRYLDARSLAERQRQELIAQQKQTMEELKRSNAELDDFSYIISHDLKEPLRNISNFTGFLKEDYGDRLEPGGLELLDILAKSAERAEDLIDSLLKYSRLGRGDLAFQKTDIGELVHETLDRLELSLKNVKIVLPSHWPSIVCDRVRVGEIFHNLILNGIKYNTSKRKMIELGYENNSDKEGEIVFFVRDNGIGIGEEYKRMIFKIFKRLHGPELYGGGTGSGLTIAQKIVERHRGKIWVESTPGNGTTFLFTLGEKTV